MRLLPAGPTGGDLRGCTHLHNGDWFERVIRTNHRLCSVEGPTGSRLHRRRSRTCQSHGRDYSAYSSPITHLCRRSWFVLWPATDRYSFLACPASMPIPAIRPIFFFNLWSPRPARSRRRRPSWTHDAYYQSRLDKAANQFVFQTFDERFRRADGQRWTFRRAARSRADPSGDRDQLQATRPFSRTRDLS